MNILYISILWIGYYALHSAFAADGMKRFFASYVAFAAPYYRMIYSFFAAANFILLLWLHFLLPSEQIFENGWISVAIGVISAGLGVVLFARSAVQYGGGFLVREELFNISGRAELHTEGVNRIVRHPLYTSILLLLLAFVLFSPEWKNLVMAVISAGYILIGTLLEERKLINRFGDAYRQYQREVKMLIPYLF